MPASPLFTAVSSSARQLLLLLRCIAFAKNVQVRITREGLRFSTEQGSSMEAFVFLNKSLFTAYTYNVEEESASQTFGEDILFEISLNSLLETLNIFSLSDPNAMKRPGDDGFAAHRLNRHAAIDAFSNRALGMNGSCTFTYDGIGTPLSIHMSEAGVSTTCDLSTYEASTSEEIPFNREGVALKSIMKSSFLLDCSMELGSVSPEHVTVLARPTTARRAGLSFSSSGALGSSTLDFAVPNASDSPILETFQCSTQTQVSFMFSVFKSAQRAMMAATKVSLRVDDQGVLSLQFLVEVEPGPNGGDAVAFVDFRAVPLVEGEADAETDSSEE